MTNPLADAMIRSEIEKLEVPKMIIWVDKEMKVETTHLTEKTVDEIMLLITKSNQELLSRVDRELPEKLLVGEYWLMDKKGHQARRYTGPDTALGCNEAIDQTKATIAKIRGEL